MTGWCELAKKKSKLIVPGKKSGGSALKSGLVGAGVGVGATVLSQFLLDWIFGDKKNPNLSIQTNLASLMAGGGGALGTVRPGPTDRLSYPAPVLDPGWVRTDRSRDLGGWGGIPDWDPEWDPARSAAWEARYGPGASDWAREHAGPGTSVIPGEQYY
jgi:hypothetical protein